MFYFQLLDRNVSPTEAGFVSILFTGLSTPRLRSPLEQCLTRCRHSTNVCWMNEWTTRRRNRTGTYFGTICVKHVVKVTSLSLCHCCPRIYKWKMSCPTGKQMQLKCNHWIWLGAESRKGEVLLYELLSLGSLPTNRTQTPAAVTILVSQQGGEELLRVAPWTSNLQRHGHLAVKNRS